MRSVVLVLTPRTRHGASRTSSLGVRCFSLRSPSSSSSSSPPSTANESTPALLAGWDARWGVIERSVLRLSRLLSYTQQELFAPSLSVLHHAQLYAVLNAPQRVDLDLAEFLEGAAIAAQRVLEDANSTAFVLSVKGRASHASPVVDSMRSYCLPACFHQLQTSLQRHLAKQQAFETLDVDVESVSLTRAGYGRLTEHEYAEELRGAPLTATHILTNRLSEDEDNATVERLQLQVEVRTSERVRVTESVGNNRQRVSVLQQRNVYVARFTSRVTTPDELDWRLASMAVRTKGKPTQLSRTLLPLH